MTFDQQMKMAKRKRHAWQVACETAVVTKDDAFLIYERLLKQFEELDPIENKDESDKTH